MLTIDVARRWDGYGLTTAHILYGMPDHPAVVQTFVWQCYDVAPDFPALRRFLDFWDRELEGPLRSVKVAHRRLIRAGAISPVAAELQVQ